MKKTVKKRKRKQRMSFERDMMEVFEVMMRDDYKIEFSALRGDADTMEVIIEQRVGSGRYRSASHISLNTTNDSDFIGLLLSAHKEIKSAAKLRKDFK